MIRAEGSPFNPIGKPFRPRALRTAPRCADVGAPTSSLLGGQALYIRYLLRVSGSTSSSHFRSRSAFCASSFSLEARLFSRTLSST